MPLPSPLLRYGAERWPYVAVQCGEKEITYQQLQDQSRKIASQLYIKGVRRGDRVVVMTSRCIEMVILFYGVLEAGACYVPVDLDNLSADRIASILHAVEPSLIV